MTAVELADVKHFNGLFLLCLHFSSFKIFFPSEKFPLLKVL